MVVNDSQCLDYFRRSKWGYNRLLGKGSAKATNCEFQTASSERTVDLAIAKRY